VLKIDPNVYQDYKKQLRIGSMNLADYGVILELGWGEPPQAIRDKYL
jgi:hypothetical protein